MAPKFKSDSRRRPPQYNLLDFIQSSFEIGLKKSHGFRSIAKKQRQINQNIGPSYSRA